MKENKQDMPSIWIDPDDAPELTEDIFAQADEFVGDKLVKPRELWLKIQN
jgi:hypothetical protein